MAQASTSGGEKAASLVPQALRAKRWRLPVAQRLSVSMPARSFACRKEPCPEAIDARPRCIPVNTKGSENPIVQRN
jgi:hypothetical protein